MSEKFEKAKELIQKYGQEQLLACYEKLDQNTKEKLLDDILNINFEQVNELYKNMNNYKSQTNVKIEHIPYTNKEKLTEEEKKYYKNIGEKAIKNNEYAVITMAGGQGTRLGHTGPKGTYKLPEPINKSIFEILTDTMKGYVKEYEVEIPWYIMTSEENNKQTVEFFKENNYFGYNKEYIKFFIQGQLPMLNEEGKILLNEEGRVKRAADGHGGIFKCIKEQGVLDDMKNKGVKWIFICGVDNILVKPVDDILLGLTIDKNVLGATKSLVKSYPEEKVGVFCKKNGRPCVVEYTEISKEMAEERLENGELKYAESHILSNLFNIKVLEEMSNTKFNYHVAHKKANYMDENGEIVVATEPNAYKFESFMFDAFEKLDDIAILRVKRENEFSPIKNATGVDSPETASKMYLEFHKN